MRIHALLFLVTMPLLTPDALAGTRGGPTELLSAVAALRSHITGSVNLTASQIAAHKRTIDANRSLFGSSSAIITACLDLVGTYDRIKGPLWVSRGQFDRRTQPNDLPWTIYHVMQYIMDEVYTTTNITKHEALLKGFKFGSSANFPGALTPPSNPGRTHTVSINASYLNTFGRPVMHASRPARKPTGTYLAPGSIGTVTVPLSLVGKGYTIRVGAHSWDLSNRPWVRRLDRSTLVYDIKSTTTKVASPLGGGIYIEVPYLANAGVVVVATTNTRRSPYFSAKSFHSTTLAEWRNTERLRKAPWADFQSDKFMMQVPTSWIYQLSDPVTLMKDWDAAMDATNDLMGFPHVQGKEAMYAQVDVLFRASVYAPGYPSVNITYSPTRNYGGNHSHHLLRGPQKAAYYEFHEMGHGYLFRKFPGETESNVNLLHVAVWNRKFGYPLDRAFEKSMNYNNAYRTLDTTSVAWMMCENFKQRTIMEPGEKQYQLKGHAKFVDIARMFGWGVLGDYWKSFNDDYENNIGSRTDIDSLLLRMSMNVGVDVTPLFHFWGVHPIDPGTLRSRIAAAKLPPSTAILNTLRKYESLVPADNAAFQAFALKWWKRIPRSTGYWTERDHAMLWNTYDKSYAATIRSNIRRIVSLYFDIDRAKLSVVGVGCIASGQPPHLTGSRPLVGTSELLILYGAPANEPGVILLGFPHSGIDVGYGCKLYLDLAFPTFSILGTTNGSGMLLPSPFPIGAALVGVKIGAQGGVNNPASLPFGISLTNGLVLQVGY